MNHSFFVFVGLIALVCIFGFINEKVTKLTHEISLMLFSVAAGIIFLVSGLLLTDSTVSQLLEKSHIINIESFLMEGVLCFMLFAGSCHLKLTDFKKHSRQIGVLAFVCTFLGALFYGLLFFAAAKLMRLELSLPVCLMFGSIVAPTDPIAATSILSKFGLPKNISFLIEGESLLNDGVGVALFVFFSGMVTATSSGGFLPVMLKEILGAVAVGVVVTFICFFMFLNTKSKTLGIFLSLLTVSLSYSLCELLGFSGAIASVVCGLVFSALRSRYAPKEDEERRIMFDSFWETIDVLFNSLLYVMLGLYFVHILQMKHVVLLSLIAIAANLIARTASVSLSSLIMGNIPDGYNRLSFIKLMTWGGLRGGLSVALAMSTAEFMPEQTYYIILGGTYAIVFFTTVIQGLTMKPVYGRIESSLKKKKAS